MEFKNLEEKCLYYRKLTDYELNKDDRYILAMVDGRSFSRMVKNKFKKPFDDDFINMMNETAKYLCEKVQGCKMAYVQSDEISLLISLSEDSSKFFGGRLCKMNSIIAALATAKFNQLIMQYELNKRSYDITKLDGIDTIYTIKDAVKLMGELPLYEFDCKVWSVPTANDAFCWFLWRQNDCIKNSKQQSSQTYCSYNELLRLTADEQIEFCEKKTGIKWCDYPDDRKYGRYIVQQNQEMTKFVEALGKEITFERGVWTTMPSFPLSESGNKERFLELVPYLNDTSDR